MKGVRIVKKIKKYLKYAKKAEDLGARDTKIIPVDSVVTEEWVRLKCRFGCDGYGKKLTCPPYSPTPEETKRALANYRWALLIHGDEYSDINEIVARLEKEIFLEGYYKAFGMGSGPCSLCARCPQFCRYPEDARPSMEACGIDVFATVKNNGFPIEVLKTTQCKGNYYGVIFME